MTIRRAPTLKTGTFSRFQFGESEREDIVYKKQLKNPHTQILVEESVRISSIVKGIKKPLGQLHNIETKVKNMTETTYENLTRHIDRISAEMREIGEKKWA